MLVVTKPNGVRTMKLKAIKHNLLLVLEDVDRAKAADAESAYDICQGLSDAAILLSDMIEELNKKSNKLPNIGGFSPKDIRTYLETEEGVVLTKEEFKRFIQYMDEKFDASIGLSWDLIPVHYDLWKGKQ
jgi:hypothetical protein